MKRQGRDDEREFLDQVFVHWEGLYRYALRLTGSPEQAEDLVQEALAKALKAFGRLRAETNHRAWIYTILRNTFLSRARRRGRELPLDDPDTLPDELTADGAPAAELAIVRAEDGYRQGFEDEVLAALDALPEVQRSAVVLCDIEGLSYGEISHVLGCPVGTVRSRIHHARRRLRETLTSYANARGYNDVEHAG